MQVPLAKFLELLEPENALDVRCAAARVLGELGVRDAASAKALCARLDDEQPAVRLAVIKTIGKLRVEQALSKLLERVTHGGEEAEQAAVAAAHLGPKGTRGLQALMPKVAPGLRRYIAAALAAGGTSSAETAAVAVLRDSDPGVIEATVRSFIERLPNLSQAERRTILAQLLELLRDKKAGLTPASEAAVIRLLSALNDRRAEALLWDRTLPPRAPEVRAAALQALGKWADQPNKEQLKKLFACALDTDFHVAATALTILRQLTVTTPAVPGWLSLLRAPDVAVRQLALAKLSDRDSADVADALLEQMTHPDRTLRESALTRLTQMAHGRKALVNALLEADSPDRAWMLAKAQSQLARDLSATVRDQVFRQACAYLEANDRRADPLLFLLRSTDAGDLRDHLHERALAFRKKKEYATALVYLRPLARDPACGFPVRLEVAACGLKVSNHDLAAEARANDPGLTQFTSLCHDFPDELGQELAKMKWLEPEDLYYLGFHLTELEGRQKKLGGEVLHLLLKRSPRGKLAQAARSKLRSAGLD